MTKTSLLGTITSNVTVLVLTLPTASAANWLGVSDSSLRDGDVSFGTIPAIILNVTNFLLSFVGTISMIMIIYGAVRMGYGAVANDKEVGKKIISAGIFGFIIAVSGWFIINLIIDNF